MCWRFGGSIAWNWTGDGGANARKVRHAFPGLSEFCDIRGISLSVALSVCRSAHSKRDGPAISSRVWLDLSWVSWDVMGCHRRSWRVFQTISYSKMVRVGCILGRRTAADSKDTIILDEESSLTLLYVADLPQKRYVYHLAEHVMLSHLFVHSCSFPPPSRASSNIIGGSPFLPSFPQAQLIRTRVERRFAIGWVHKLSLW